ncbi:MAG: NrtA/SsuA/CpmA family ABC transporter substrate-binding protein, partial [Nitrospirales bacterium]|nr:NrtA/SsuA/CpmA family ABC transporter substrate-binding protein [Nitrospirales bacterium]
MRKRKILAATLFSAVILGVLISLLTAGQRHRPAAGPPERITFADSRQFVSALVYVADAKGFFREEGLELLFRESPSEKDSLQAVVEGTAQLAAVSSTPVVLNVLKGEEVCVIVTIADSDRYTRIVARKDRGISGPDDLAGKRIGVSIGTNAEFFLDMYLVFHGVPLKGVHLVDLRPGQLVDALLSGEVDAASLGDPFAGILESRLGSGSLVLSEEGIYKMNWNIAARKDFVHNNRGRIRKFLRALVKAESYSAKRH